MAAQLMPYLLFEAGDGDAQWNTICTPSSAGKMSWMVM